jgi:hypothetical protein
MGIRFVSLPILIVLSLSLIACTDEGAPPALGPGPGGSPLSYSYRAYNSAGNLLVVGTLTMTMEDSTSIVGSWALDQVQVSDKVGPQVGTGKLAGMMAGKSVSINLNPSWVDKNVFLQGTMDDSRMSGKWMWSTFVGSTAEGTFEAIKKQ